LPISAICLCFNVPLTDPDQQHIPQPHLTDDSAIDGDRTAADTLEEDTHGDTIMHPAEEENLGSVSMLDYA
jgi:hypothetical protein